MKIRSGRRGRKNWALIFLTTVIQNEYETSQTSKICADFGRILAKVVATCVRIMFKRLSADVAGRHDIA